METKYYPGWYKNKPIIKKSRKKWPKNVSDQYKRYYDRCLRINRPMELTPEEFNQIIINPCTYCGNTINNGIDRIDSSKGYTIENSQSCCSRCNMMKMDMTHNSFISHINLIIKHLQLNI